MKNGAAEFIEINPKVMLGKPVVRGTRITVELILEKLSNGESFEEILAEHPRLKREHIFAALAFAASSLRGEMHVPTPVAAWNSWQKGVDGTLVAMLRSAGHDVIYFAETDRSTDDAVILEIANSENRILITRDLDFGELVWRMKMVHTGIVLVRAEELSSATRSKLVADFIEANPDLLSNHFIVIQPGTARIRKMQPE